MRGVAKVRMVRGARRRAPLMPTRYNLAQGILFATTRFEPDPTRTDTGADFIGSILIDFDENGDYIAERRYKPYGELLAGTATTYGWTGNTGSRATLLQYAEQYNRRRHYSTKLKQWTTRDPLWPEESAYRYVSGRPLTWNDPSGMREFSASDLPIPYVSQVATALNLIGCNICGASLYLKWAGNHSIHRCNYAYSHCMTCCVLASKFGSSCAQNLQVSQIAFKDVEAYKDKRNYNRSDQRQFRMKRNLQRMGQCITGITFATHAGFDYPSENHRNWFGKCHRGCAGRYPFNRKLPLAKHPCTSKDYKGYSPNDVATPFCGHFDCKMIEGHDRQKPYGSLPIGDWFGKYWNKTYG